MGTFFYRFSVTYLCELTESGMQKLVGSSPSRDRNFMFAKVEGRPKFRFLLVLFHFFWILQKFFLAVLPPVFWCTKYKFAISKSKGPLLTTSYWTTKSGKLGPQLGLVVGARGLEAGVGGFESRSCHEKTNCEFVSNQCRTYVFCQTQLET